MLKIQLITIRKRLSRVFFGFLLGATASATMVVIGRPELAIICFLSTIAIILMAIYELLWFVFIGKGEPSMDNLKLKEYSYIPERRRACPKCSEQIVIHPDHTERCSNPDCNYQRR